MSFVTFEVGGEFGEESVDHVVGLQHFYFEIVQHLFEVVELVYGIWRVQVSVPHFILCIIFLEGIIMNFFL